MRMDGHGVRTLQTRVDADTARHFSTLARETGVSESELLRQAVRKLLAEAQDHVDALKERLRTQLD